MSQLNLALQYARKNWPVFPLFYVTKSGACSCRKLKCSRAGKHPVTRNGLQDASTDEAQITQWWTESPFANIGLATGHNGLVVLDVDEGNAKVGPESLEALLANYGKQGLPPTLVCKTGGGGRHYYFLSPHQIPNSQSKIGPDLDVRGAGGYCIVPGSNHVSGGHYEWLADPLTTPIADMPAWLEAKCMSSHIDVSEDELQAEVKEDAQRKEHQKLTPELIVRLLDHIPSDCDRDMWWKVGAALKKELGDKNGFAAWDNWSRKSPDKYDAKVMPVQWNSFEDKGITAGTLVQYAKDNGFRGFDIETADSEEFKENWVYAASIKRFVETNLLIEWDKEQFDAMHARLFTKGKASDHVLRNPNFKLVNGVTYWPAQPMYVVEYGQEKLNYWRKGEVTPAPGDVSPFLDHVKYLYPDPEEAKILLQFLAYQVQHPGEKVHWALLLEGDQGNGKSYFATVMRTVLGDSNVKMVHNDQLHETFTGWQRNCQLVVVEEMMARARLELMNKLKPMITESWCTIREMYRPPYEQPNRFNFLFFSNHKDSLIIDALDRRYCILKTFAAAHPRMNEYYGPLFNWTRANGPALLWYLGQVSLEDFKPKSHAPMTEGKKALVLQSMLPLDAFLLEHATSGEYPMRWDLVTPSSLVKPLGDYNLRANPKEIGNAFARLGFVQLGRMRGLAMNGDGATDRTPIWAIRNFDQYRELEGPQVRQLYMMQIVGAGNVSGADADAEAIYKNRPRNPLEDERSM